MSDRDERDEDDAARAFEQLRAEVAHLRQGIELVYRQGQEARAEAKGAAANVDYGLTLGRMEKTLQAMQSRLEMIEQHPAVRTPPDAYRRAVVSNGEPLIRDLVLKLPGHRGGDA